MSTATAGKVLLIPKGEYDATTQYKVLDWVLYQGRPYVAKQTTTGNAPIYAPTPQNPDAYWQLLLDFPTVVDNVPTQNSQNLVRSGGVYSAISTATQNAVNEKTLTATVQLSASQSVTHTFTDASITASSDVDLTASVQGVIVTDYTVTTGQCVVTFWKDANAREITATLHVRI